MTAPIDPRRQVLLTPGQNRVLRELVRDGATNSQIAARLGLVEDTVKTHCKDILKAMGASTRTEAVVLCLRNKVRVTVRSPDTVPGRKVKVTS